MPRPETRSDAASLSLDPQRDRQRAQLDNRLSLPDGPQGFPERGHTPREGSLNFRSAPRFPRRDRDKPKDVTVGRATFAFPSTTAMDGLIEATSSDRKHLLGLQRRASCRVK